MPGDEPISPEEPRHGQTPGLARVLPSKHTKAIALVAQWVSVRDFLRRLFLVWNIARVGIFDCLFYSQIAPFPHPNYFSRGKHL
jgi:hypothetical protein